jgi:hypothetical protein
MGEVEDGGNDRIMRGDDRPSPFCVFRLSRAADATGTEPVVPLECEEVDAAGWTDSYERRRLLSSRSGYETHHRQYRLARDGRAMIWWATLLKDRSCGSV